MPNFKCDILTNFQTMCRRSSKDRWSWWWKISFTATLQSTAAVGKSRMNARQEQPKPSFLIIGNWQASQLQLEKFGLKFFYYHHYFASSTTTLAWLGFYCVAVLAPKLLYWCYEAKTKASRYYSFAVSLSRVGIRELPEKILSRLFPEFFFDFPGIFATRGQKIKSCFPYRMGQSFRSYVRFVYLRIKLVHL